MWGPTRRPRELVAGAQEEPGGARGRDPPDSSLMPADAYNLWPIGFTLLAVKTAPARSFRETKRSEASFKQIRRFLNADANA